MPVPDRSTLPPKFVAFLDHQNSELANYEPPKPILPAPTTPQELIDAAQHLDHTIQTHRADNSLAAELIEKQFRPIINAVLNKTITEPIPDNWYPIRWGDTDLYEPKREDLENAWVRLIVLVTGVDKTRPAARRAFRMFSLSHRKEAARRLGLELDLTDDEWWQL